MFDISFCVPPHRHEVVADIFVDRNQLAEIKREGFKRVVEIYARADGQPWVLDLRELQENLEVALSKLNNRLP
jgi:hypothetical protein